MPCGQSTSAVPFLSVQARVAILRGEIALPPGGWGTLGMAIFLHPYSRLNSPLSGTLAGLPAAGLASVRLRKGRSMFTRAFAATIFATIGVASPGLAQTAPSLTKSPAVTDEPGRGMIPSVSAHTAASPMLYELDQQPVEQISPLVQRQYLSGVDSTFVKWTVKAGGVFPLHHHLNEQITWIVKGRCDVFSQGKHFEMTAGTILVIPPNIPHEFICPEDTIDVDFFSPARQDWADGAPSIAAKP
jgi:quercetin dioxygenase-like cupin family protein